MTSAPDFFRCRIGNTKLVKTGSGKVIIYILFLAGLKAYVNSG